MRKLILMENIHPTCCKWREYLSTLFILLHLITPWKIPPLRGGCSYIKMDIPIISSHYTTINLYGAKTPSKTIPINSYSFPLSYTTQVMESPSLQELFHAIKIHFQQSNIGWTRNIIVRNWSSLSYRPCFFLLST